MRTCRCVSVAQTKAPSARLFDSRSAEPDQLGLRPKAAGQSEESTIESGDLAIVAAGEQQQMSVGHCTAAMHALSKHVSMVGDTDRIRPECMTTDGPEAGEEMRCLAGRARVGNHPVIARNSDKSRFGNRARCPPFEMVGQKPFGRRCVVHVRRPGECNEDIDVKETHQASSIASRTISSVIGRASGRTSNVGRPVTAEVECRSSRPQRANSETIEPRERPCSRDNARATARTRSSMSRVVRMP